MATLRKSTYQSQTINLPANVVTAVTFNGLAGLAPNAFQIYNYGTASVNVGDNSAMTASSNYAFIIAGSGIGTFCNPVNIATLYFLTTVQCVLRVNSWLADDVTSAELAQTQSTTIINSTVTSSVQLAAALPAGTNNIGHVTVDGAPHVNVDTLPALPAGTNVIGHAIVDSGNIAINAPIPAGTNVIGHVIADASSAVIGHVIVDTLPSIFPSSAPVIYNVTLTSANTEYSQVIASGHKLGISIQNGGGSDNFRIAYTTGKVATPTAPYLQFPQNGVYWIDNDNITSLTVYLASSIAGKVAQIEVW